MIFTGSHQLVINFNILFKNVYYIQEEIELINSDDD